MKIFQSNEKKELKREEVIYEIIDALEHNRLPTVYDLQYLQKKGVNFSRSMWEEGVILSVISLPFLAGMIWTYNNFRIASGYDLLLYGIVEFILALIPCYLIYSFISNQIIRKKLQKYSTEMKKIMLYYEKNPIDWERIDGERMKRVLNSIFVNR